MSAVSGWRLKKARLCSSSGLCLLLSLIVWHATRHFVASFSPAIGRASHTPVRFVSFPTAATEVALGRCGVDKRWKGILHNQVETVATKHVASIAQLALWSRRNSA